MDPEEFKTSLAQLNSEISLIVSCRAAFYASWQTEKQLDTLNRHRGFFSPARESLRQTMLMTTARIVDTDTRTASIPNLVKAIRENPKLLPYGSETVIEGLERKVAALSGVVARLTQLRNQRLAHWDRGDVILPGIQKQEMDHLIDQSIEVFNDISSAFDRSVTSWLQIERDAERHTKLLFEVAELGIIARKDKIEKEIFGDLEPKE